MGERSGLFLGNVSWEIGGNIGPNVVHPMDRQLESPSSSLYGSPS